MPETIFNIEEIISSIPHRYPLLLVDKVIDFQPNESIIGIKNVTFNEPHFAGHFPGRPIMPGVLIVEAMAQAGAILVIKSTPEIKPENFLVYFTSIDEVKFRKPVVPGDCLELHVKTIQKRLNIWKMSGVGMVDGKKVTEATFSAMLIDKSKS